MYPGRTPNDLLEDTFKIGLKTVGRQFLRWSKSYLDNGKKQISSAGPAALYKRGPTTK